MYSLAQSRRLLLLGLTLALLGSVPLGYAFPPRPASSQAENSQDIATQRALVHAVEAQRVAIDKENSTSPSVAWAGDYYFGDGMGQLIVDEERVDLFWNDMAAN